MTKQDLATMYWFVKREPKEGTITNAIRVHAQACGLVAYLFDLHPDEIARAVAETPKSRIPG